MFIRSLDDCDECIAGDGALLRELLHPAKADVEIRYSLAHAKVRPGETTKPHRLAATEVYYVIQGSGEMFIENKSQPVAVGCAVYIPPGATQYIRNTGTDDLIFLCIVDPAWQSKDEEILED